MPLNTIVPRITHRVEAGSVRASAELDVLQASFFQEALRPSALMGMMGAGLVSAGSKFFSSGLAASLGAFAAEVFAFEAIGHYSRIYLEGSEEAGFREGLGKSALSLASLQLSARFFQTSHPLFGHFIQDAALVLSQNISELSEPRKNAPSSLAQQFIYAEAMTLQMGAMAFVTARFLPYFRAAPNFRKFSRDSLRREVRLQCVSQESNGLCSKLQERTLQGGARLWTSSPVDVDLALTLSQGRDVMLCGEKFGDLLEVEHFVGPWPIKNTPLRQMSENFGIDVVEWVATRAQSSPHPITVLDWGCGQGVALMDLERALRIRGIHNVRYFGFSDVYYHRWNEASAAHTFIFDSGFRYGNYFKAGEIDIMMSYFGWNWWFSHEFVKKPGNISRAYAQLQELLSPQGSFIHLPAWPNPYLEGLMNKCGLVAEQRNGTTQVLRPSRK